MDKESIEKACEKYQAKYKLPRLRGSPRAYAWAREIRAKLIIENKELVKECFELLERCDSDAERDELADQYGLAGSILTETSCQFFIDARQYLKFNW